MNQVQFLVLGQARPREIAGPDDCRIRAQAVVPVIGANAVAVEDIRLGVQEALVEQPDLRLVHPQEGDQVLHEPKHLLLERLGFQFAPHLGQHGLGVRPKANVRAAGRLSPQEQTERPQSVQPILHQPVAADGEVRGRDVQRTTFGRGQQRVQHVGCFDLLIVDNERKRHHFTLSISL